jgi:hypothetical protein
MYYDSLFECFVDILVNLVLPCCAVFGVLHVLGRIFFGG